MNIFSPRSVMGMPPAIAIASWHSLMEIIGGVRKRFLNASSSAMMARACVVRSSFSLAVKRLISADPLFIYDSKVGDEHLLPTQCHGHAQSCHVPATRNLNCPSAITDGSLRHALLPLVGSARPRRPDRTGHPPQSLKPTVSSSKGSFLASESSLSENYNLHWVRPKTLRRRPLPLGGNDPAAIGAGLGSLFPLRVIALSREVTSLKDGLRIPDYHSR